MRRSHVDQRSRRYAAMLRQALKKLGQICGLIPWYEPAENAGPLFTLSGEIVTCENGHEICEIMTPIRRHDPVMASQFGNFRDGVTPPHVGDDIDGHCHVCGGKWIKVREDGLGLQVHLRGEWRPSVAVCSSL